MHDEIRRPLGDRGEQGWKLCGRAEAAEPPAERVRPPLVERQLLQPLAIRGVERFHVGRLEPGGEEPKAVGLDPVAVERRRGERDVVATAGERARERDERQEVAVADRAGEEDAHRVVSSRGVGVAGNALAWRDPLQGAESSPQCGWPVVRRVQRTSDPSAARIVSPSRGMVYRPNE